MDEKTPRRRKPDDVWFARVFIGYMPVHLNGILVMLCIPISLGAFSGADWLTAHNFDPLLAQALGVFGIALLIFWFVMFFRHTDWK